MNHMSDRCLEKNKKKKRNTRSFVCNPLVHKHYSTMFGDDVKEENHLQLKCVISFLAAGDFEGFLPCSRY